jgi:serine/threonine protein kinase
MTKRKKVGTDDKAKSERKDLQFVISALFNDSNILKSETLLDQYLSPDNASLLRGMDKIPLNKLDLMLEAGARVHVGGGGVVVQCANRTQPTIKYALKIPRPSLFQGGGIKVKQNYEAAIDEYLKHAPLSHENVARVFGSDTMLIHDKKGRRIGHAVIQMEWIDGATPLNKYLFDSETDYRGVVNTLTQCFQALAYIHDRSLTHWDVKSDNLLVSGGGVVTLSALSGTVSSRGSTLGKS